MNIYSPVISGSLTITGSTTIIGNLTITSGSLISTASNAMALDGTGSLAFVTTASYNPTSASFSSVLTSVSSSQQQISASLLQVSASYISLSGSYNTFSGSASTRITTVSASQQDISASLLQVSASYIALSGSYNIFSGSVSTRITTVSSSQQQISASLLNVVANYATTGSNSFRADQSITGSLVVSSTITAQTLVVQTVTSSIVYSSGSNNFGNQLANTQTFTGSVNITGSLALAGNITSNGTAVMLGTGTTNYLPKFTGASTIGDSAITDVSGIIKIGTTASTTYGTLTIVQQSVAAPSFVRGIQLVHPNGTGVTGGYIGISVSGQKQGQIQVGDDSNSGDLIINPAGGNLGLGVTPSAWDASFKALQIGVYAGLSDNSGGGGGYALFGNSYEYSVGAYKYLQNYYATLYRTYAGQHQWYNAPSGTAGNAISFTQAMTLDASGNLGVGETSPSSFGKLAVYGGAANTIVSIKTNSFDGTYYTALNFSTGGQGANDPQAQIRVVGENNYSASMRFLTQTSGTTNPLVEKMRLFNDGNLLLQSGGTFTNAGYKLDVNGTGRFSAVLSVFVGGNDTRLANFSTSTYGSARGLRINSYQSSNGGQDCAIEFDSGVAGYGGFKLSNSGTPMLTLLATGAATFSSSVTATAGIFSTITSITNGDQSGARLTIANTGTGGQSINLIAGNPNVDNTGFSLAYGNINFLRFTSTGDARFTTKLSIGPADPTAVLDAQGGSSGTGAFLSGNVTSTYGTVMVGYGRGYPSMMYLNADCNSGGGYIAWNANTKVNVEDGNYVLNGYATKIYGGLSGQIRTYTAASGTAGNAISYTAGPYVANTGVSWTNGSSDERLKKNFEPTQGLAEILQINPVKYHFKTDNDSAVKRLGFTAQNLKSLIPEMVVEKDDLAPDGSHYLTITPDYLLPVLVKAIQEQQCTINTLKTCLGIS